MSKKHPNLFDVFFIEEYELRGTFFGNFSFKTTFLLKLGTIFDKAAKLGKSIRDTYNLEGWLIL